MPPDLTSAVALLRGVNVGGNKRVPMADLRRLLAGLGYADVVTLLNSGNAAFRATPTALATGEADVEAALEAELGVSCSVVVRTGAELVAALAADPLAEVATDSSRHLVGFLSAEPEQAFEDWLAALDLAPDQIRLIGRHVYLWVPAGVTNGPLSKLGWERRLGVTVTSRNVNTVAKLIELTSD
jgi:uncharacterized protein (DUF1697 family)